MCVTDRSGTPQATAGSAEYSEEPDPTKEGNAQKGKTDRTAAQE
jgi:hypothetical protein